MCMDNNGVIMDGKSIIFGHIVLTRIKRPKLMITTWFSNYRETYVAKLGIELK